jgi:hypothetical protein
LGFLVGGGSVDESFRVLNFDGATVLSICSN